MLALFGVQPHRSKSFKLSTDPAFVDKLRDIVGLYLDPPGNAVVLCVDEKTQIQADGPGRSCHCDWDTPRASPTTTSGTARRHCSPLSTSPMGQVIAQYRQRHRHQEFLSFLKRIDAAVPAGLDAHLVVDNYATHEHPKVRALLAARPRFHVNHTPTYSSWLNQIERWFAILTQRQIRRPSCVGAKDLIAESEAIIAADNAKAHPFAWTATGEAILEKVERVCNVICGTVH